MVNKEKRQACSPYFPSSSPSRDTYPTISLVYSSNTRMRPPTRSTRSVRQRQPSKKVSPNTRGSPPTPASFLLEVNPQPTESIADSNIEVGTPVSTSVAGSLPSGSWAPTTFVYENQKLVSGRAGAPDHAIVTPAGKKQPRSRHRMTSDKLETLDACFRRNTHPSRKEKEAICKDLDM